MNNRLITHHRRSCCDRQEPSHHPADSRPGKGGSFLTMFRWRSCFILSAALALACIVFLPKAQAVVPAPDGGYPGFNTGRKEPMP